MAGKLLDETGLAELWSLIKAGDAKAAKIVTGEYNGTGQYYSKANNYYENTLTFDFEPKLVIIVAGSSSDADGAYGGYSGTNEAMFLTKHRVIRTSDATNTLGYGVYVKFSGNTVTWYSSTSATCQGNDATGASNENPVHYRYTAIG